MPSGAVAVQKPRLLVVEGVDEERFFGSLLSSIGRDDVQVLPIGGKTRLPQTLRALKFTPGFSSVTALGVVRDADDDFDAAFGSACSALAAAEFDAPDSHGVFSAGALRVGVWIMPDGTRPGMLEDLCLESVDPDPATACVDAFMQCLAERIEEQPKSEPKARLHAFLASRPEPDRRLGEAAEAGYWPWDSRAFAPLKRFLSAL